MSDAGTQTAAAATVTVPVMSQARAQVGELVVPAAVLAGPVREHLLHEMVKSQLASRRAGTAAAKKEALRAAGATIVDSPADIGEVAAQVLAKTPA